MFQSLPLHDIYIVVSTISYCIAMRSGLTIVFLSLKSLMDPRAMHPENLKKAFTDNFFRGVSVILAIVVYYYADAYKIYELPMRYSNTTSTIMGTMLFGSLIYLLRRLWIIFINK